MGLKSPAIGYQALDTYFCLFHRMSKEVVAVACICLFTDRTFWREDGNRHIFAPSKDKKTKNKYINKQINKQKRL